MSSGILARACFRALRSQGTLIRATQQLPRAIPLRVARFNTSATRFVGSPFGEDADGADAPARQEGWSTKASPTLFVANLAWDTTIDDLKDAFGQFGELAEIRIGLCSNFFTRRLAEQLQ